MQPSDSSRPFAYERSFMAVIAVAGMAPLGMLSVVPFAFGESSTLWIGWIMLGGVALWLAVLATLSWKHWRMLRRVKAVDWTACPNCVYDLRHLTGDRCPECGVPATKSEVSEQWARVIARPAAKR